MARSDFGPEVSDAMKDQPSGGGSQRMPRQMVKQEQMMERSSKNAPGAPPRIRPPSNKAPGPVTAQTGSIPTNIPDAHHVAAAASIAHAILGNRGIA